MTFVFKHPKFYRIPRDKSDQAISKRQPTGESERASWSGAINGKLQATSVKLQATSVKLQATSVKLQAPSIKLSNQPVQSPSDKHPNQSNKRQASSRK